MEPLIVYADLDTFFVSVQRLLNLSLVGKPVIVGGDPQGRGVVAACSYEARAYGVKSGMSASDAYRLCPQAIFTRGHGEYYGYYSRLVKELLLAFTPEVHPQSIDEFACDFSGMERIYPDPAALARRIREKVYLATGLPMSIGLATNSLVAKVAAGEAKPDGFRIVPPGEEARFLAPLPLSRLPGIGPVTEETLAAMGLRTLGEVAAFPVRLLKAALGRNGEILHQKARGKMVHTVSEEPVTKSLGHETTFRDVADPRRLLGILAGLTAEAGFRLRAGGFTTRLITLKLRYRDFQTVSMQRQVPPLFADEDIFTTVKELLPRLFTRRVGVRLVGVRLSRLVRDLHQLPLFEWERRMQQKNLCAALDRIHHRFGLESITPLATARSERAPFPLPPLAGPAAVVEAGATASPRIGCRASSS